MYSVLQYIHNNIQRPLSVEEVAKEFGYSKWYFCDKFKSYTGKSFLEYVRHYRISLAAMEILTGKKVVDVALSYGYDSISGFNKAFLKEYGCSPKNYLKQIKSSQLYYEKRRLTMFQITDRCAELRDDAVNKKSLMKYYYAQRNSYFAIGKWESILKEDHPIVNVASGVAYTLDKFNPIIAPGEVIVGFNFGEGDLSEYFWPKTKEEHGDIMRENGISEADIDRYFELKAINPTVKETYHLSFTKEEQQSEEEWAAIGRCITCNHSVIGYEKVLKKGFEGILKEIYADEKFQTNPLHKATALICEKALTMGEKYAQKAKEILKKNDEAYNSRDLEKIIEICENVPRHGAKSFIEAVQSLWFAHIINTWEDGINANSLGRLDQILYPYYKADIEKGVITKEEAFEIVCLLWIKLYRDYDVQQSCVGGTNLDGSSAVNELSYMMLDATEQLDFIRCLSVRYSANTEREFLRRAFEVVGHVQKGVPFFFNDDIMIPALKYKGISDEDAHDYTQIGCVETVIPGKSNPHAVSGEINLLKAIEYVLYNGKSMMYPDFAPGVKTGDLEQFTTFELFYEALLVQIKKLLILSAEKNLKRRESYKTIYPTPYKSLLTEGCMETGKDFNNQGAKYDYYQIMICAIPNFADSLAVIKKYVYEEKRYTLTELKEILEKDFPDEAVRALFINKVPKYGNDIDEVDSIAAKVMNEICDMLDELSNKYSCSFHAQPFTYFWMIHHGKHSAASADGRRKGEPIAYSCSAMQGRDFNGLTALLNSISKLPSKKAPGTTSAIIEIDPKLFNDRNIDMLVDIFMAASKKGLCNAQFNVIDAETLIDAQKHPEHYNNLAVRVSGFSQKFNLLSEELQNHIIGRTKHSCL